MQARRIFLLVLLAMLSPNARSAHENAKCDDAGKVYKICQDQGEIYRGSLSRAKEKNKTLVVVLGAEWCPWCLSLHKMLKDPKFGGDFGKKFELADIGVYQGKQKLESGEKVLKQLKDQAHVKEKIEGIPILALVNPKNEKTVLINTEPLEKNTKTKKGHDPKKVLAALEKASLELQ
jgi:hypothetical protein